MNSNKLLSATCFSVFCLLFGGCEDKEAIARAEEAIARAEKAEARAEKAEKSAQDAEKALIAEKTSASQLRQLLQEAVSQVERATAAANAAEARAKEAEKAKAAKLAQAKTEQWLLIIENILTDLKSLKNGTGLFYGIDDPSLIDKRSAELRSFNDTQFILIEKQLNTLKIQKFPFYKTLELNVRNLKNSKDGSISLMGAARSLATLTGDYKAFEKTRIENSSELRAVETKTRNAIDEIKKRLSGTEREKQ